MSTIWVDLLGAEVRYHGTRYRTRVIEAGDGPPLILIHGIGGHSEAWSRNVVRLAAEYRVLAIDLLWHGLSSKPEVPADPLPGYVDQVLDLIDSIGADRVYLEGESLGGSVTIAFALAHPDRIHAMVLNTAAGALPSGTDDVKARAALDDMRQRSLDGLADPTVEHIRHRMNWLVASPDRLTDEIIDVRRTLYSRSDVKESLTKIFTQIGERDNKVFTEEDLARLGDVPTLVFWTEKNPGKGPEVGEAIHRLIPGSEFYVMADAAHWPQWEKPEEHDEVIVDFFRRAGKA